MRKKPIFDRTLLKVYDQKIRSVKYSVHIWATYHKMRLSHIWGNPDIPELSVCQIKLKIYQDELIWLKNMRAKVKAKIVKRLIKKVD